MQNFEKNARNHKITYKNSCQFKNNIRGHAYCKRYKKHD